MRLRTTMALGAGLMSIAAHVGAATQTISFDNLPAGTILSNQYAGIGAVFSANAFVGTGTSSSGQSWATNTDMTVVGATGSDINNLGSPALAGGMVLGSYNGWLAENGDPSFRMTFSTVVTSVSADFASVATGSDVALYAFDGTVLVGKATGGANYGQFLLSVSAPSITSVVMTPGSYDDWVAVDNISFAQAVPEPAEFALMGMGLAALVLYRRKAASEAR